jgi:Arf-GAP/coiled-coil/ANK repeat/PH domain-containing protein
MSMISPVGCVWQRGYLLKRSSNLRGDWKRRYWVLDARGLLYYYRGTLGGRSDVHMSDFVAVSHPGKLGAGSAASSTPSSSWKRGRGSKSGGKAPPAGKTECQATVNLLTATIKMDAEDASLRLCFRIVSPQRCFTLQASELPSPSPPPPDYLSLGSGVSK